MTQSKTLAFPIICQTEAITQVPVQPFSFSLNCVQNKVSKTILLAKKRHLEKYLLMVWNSLKIKIQGCFFFLKLNGFKCFFLQGSSSLCCKNLCLNELFVVSPPLASITTKIICLHGWGLANVHLRADRGQRVGGRLTGKEYLINHLNWLVAVQTATKIDSHCNMFKPLVMLVFYLKEEKKRSEFDPTKLNLRV